jgi:hypothetical protein
VKVKSGSTKSTAKTSGAKATKRAEPEARTQASAPKAKAKPAEEFAGTQRGNVDRPATQLPRSGWKDTEAFKDAARTARARNTGGASSAIGTRPEIRPLYGLPMEIPLPKLTDKGLRDAAKNILRDRKITSAEVDALLLAAKDNGGLSKTEKRDLKRLMSEVGERFEAAALKKLDKAVNGSGTGSVDTRPEIRPMYGLPVPVPFTIDLQGKKLEDALKPILRDRKINAAEVDTLIGVANKNGGLSARERTDLNKLLDEGRVFMDQGAVDALELFLGRTGPVIRPLYGLPVPLPFDQNMRDKKLDVAVKQMLGDRKMTLTEVEALIKNADDGRGLSKTERQDLETLLDKAGQFFDPAAKRRLEDYVGRMPPIRPLYGLPFAFPGPQVSMMGPMGMGPGIRPASSRPTVELAHAQAFVSTAKSNGGLDSMEKSEMRMLLAGGANFTAEAKAHIEAYLRTQ